MRPPYQTESGGSFHVRRQFNSSDGYSELVETIDDDGLIVKRRIIVPAKKMKPSKPRYALSERNSREQTDAFSTYQDELGNRRYYEPTRPDNQKLRRIALAENRLRNEQKTAAQSLRQTQNELSGYLTEEPTDEESFISYPSHSPASYLRLFAGGPASPKVKSLSEQQRKVLISKNEQLLKEAGGITDDKLSRVMRDAKRILKTAVGGGNVRRDYSLKIIENLLDAPVKLHEKCLAVIEFVKKRLPRNQNTLSLERAVWDTFAEMSREAQLLAVALYEKLGFSDADMEKAVNEIREKERKKNEAQQEGIQINVQQATPVLGGVTGNRAPARQDQSKLSIKKPKSKRSPQVAVKPVPKIPVRPSVDRGKSLDPYYSKIPVAIREQMALKQKASAKSMVPKASLTRAASAKAMVQQGSVTRALPSAARLSARAPGSKALAPKASSLGARPSSAKVSMKKQVVRSASKQKMAPPQIVVSPPKIQVEHVKSEYHETPRKPSALRAHKMARPFMATPPKRSPVPLTPAKVASDAEIIAFEEGKLKQKLEQDLEVVKGMVDRENLARRVEKMHDRKREKIPEQIRQLRTPEGQWYGFPHHSPTAHLRAPQAQKAAPVAQQLSVPKVGKYDPTPLSSLGIRKRKKMVQPRTLFPQGMPDHQQATPENIAREKQRLRNQYQQASTAAKSQASNQALLAFQLNTLKAQYDQDLELLEQSQFHERTTIRIPSSNAEMVCAAPQPRVRTASPKTVSERLKDHQEIHTTQSRAAEKIQNIISPHAARQTRAPQIQAQVPQTQVQVPQIQPHTPQSRAQIPMSAEQIYAEKRRLEKEYFANLRSAHQKYADFLDLANYIRDAKAEYDGKIDKLNQMLTSLGMPYAPPPPPPKQPTPPPKLPTPPPKQPTPPKPPASRHPNLLIASTVEVPVTMRPISEFHADRVDKLRKLHAMAPVQSTELESRRESLQPPKRMTPEELVNMMDDEQEALKMQYFEDIKAARPKFPDPVEYAYYLADLKDKFDRDLRAVNEKYDEQLGIRTPSIARESLSPARQSNVAAFVETEKAKIQQTYDQDVKLAKSLIRDPEMLVKRIDTLNKVRERNMTKLMRGPSRGTPAGQTAQLSVSRQTPSIIPPTTQANEGLIAEKKQLEKNLKRAISHVKRTIPFAITQATAITKLKIQHEKDVAALEQKHIGIQPSSGLVHSSPKLGRLSMGPSLQVQSPSPKREPVQPMVGVPERAPTLGAQTLRADSRTASPPPEVLIQQARQKIKRRLNSELDVARKFKSPVQYAQHVVAANNKYKQDLQMIGDIARTISMEKLKASQEAEQPPKPESTTKTRRQSSQPREPLVGLQQLEVEKDRLATKLRRDCNQVSMKKIKSPYQYAKQITDLHRQYDRDLASLEQQHSINERLSLGPQEAATLLRSSVSKSRAMSKDQTPGTATQTIRPSPTMGPPASTFVSPASTVVAPTSTFVAPASTFVAPASTVVAQSPTFKVPALPPPVSTGTFKQTAPPLPTATLTGLELIEADREKTLRRHRREMAKARKTKHPIQRALQVGAAMNKKDKALKSLKLRESIVNVSGMNLDQTPVLSPRSKSFAMRPVPQIQVEEAEPGEEQSEEDYDVNMAALGETPKRKSHLRKLEYIPYRMAQRGLRFDPGFTPPRVLDDEEYAAAEKHRLDDKLQKMERLAKKLRNPEERMQRAQAEYDEGVEQLAPEQMRKWATPGDRWWGFPHYDPAIPIRLGPITPEIEEEEAPLIEFDEEPYQYTPAAGNERLQLHEKYLQDVEDAKAIIANPTVLQNQLDFLRRTYERDVEALNEQMMHTPTRSPVGAAYGQPQTPTRSPVAAAYGPPQTPTRSPVGAVYGPPQTPTRNLVSHVSPVRSAFTSPPFNPEYSQGIFLSADEVNDLMSKADQEYMETIESIEGEANVQDRVQLMMKAQSKRDDEKESIRTYNAKKFEAIDKYLKEKDALEGNVPENMKKFEMSILKALLLEELNKLNFSAGLEALEAIDDEQLAAAMGS